MTLPHGLAPLRHRAYRRLAAGSLASSLGDATYAVALPWYVLAHHGGVVLLSTVLAAYGITRGAALLAGGHLSDRFAPWNAMLAADVIRALALVALTLTAASGPARAAVLIPIGVVVGIGDGLFTPGSMSIVPALLPDAQLESGNAIASALQQLSGLAMPLGGLLVALVGPTPAFGVDAASFVASALALTGVGRAAARSPLDEAVEAGHVTGSGPEPAPATGTLALLRAEPVLRLILLLNVAANLGSGGMSEVALPALAHGPLHAGATGYGLLLAAFGVGALAGLALAGHLARPRRPAMLASWVFLTMAGFDALVPYLGGTVGAGVALLLFGGLAGFGNVLTGTALQRWAPRALLGRVTSVLLLGSLGVFPVSVLLGGLITRDLGAAAFFPFAGGALALAVGFALTRPRWRAFGATGAAPPALA